MSPIQRFFYNDSAAMQQQIAKLKAIQLQRQEAAAALGDEVGGVVCFNGTSVSGVKFPGKTPNGWSRNSHSGLPMPKKNTDAGKALSARLQALTLPSGAELMHGTSFVRFDLLFDGGYVYRNKVSVAFNPSGPNRALARIRMLPGAPPEREPGCSSGTDDQHEAGFVVPEGWIEWKEWEMLKWVEEFNAAIRAENAE